MVVYLIYVLLKNMQILQHEIPYLPLKHSHTPYGLPTRHPVGNTIAKYGKIWKLTSSHFDRHLL